MRRIPIFLAYGAMVVGLMGWANYTGWSLTNYDEVKNVPKSIRDNPGAYRTVYQRYYHK